MYSEIDWALLAKYFAGEVTGKEKDNVEAWLEADPLNRELFESLASTWKASSDKSVQWDVDKAWLNISSKLGLDTGARQKSKESVSRYKAPAGRYSSYARVLSSIGLIIVISISAFLYKGLNEKPAGTHKVKSTLAFHEFTTEKGQRASFKLSDGTEVFLNSASTIKFPDKFLGSKRVVYLNGEAYFKVKHNDQKPFKVLIKNGEITDIGTEFNVKAWNDDALSTVTVKEGKVSFAAEKTSGENIVYLTEMETSNLNANGILSQPARTNVNKQISWLNGRLYFENSTLGQVFKSLDRSYNFSCSVQDSSLLSLHLTAVFKEDNFKEVVNIISLALGIDYKISGNSCQFSKGKDSRIKKSKTGIHSLING